MNSSGPTQAKERALRERPLPGEKRLPWPSLARRRQRWAGVLRVGGYCVCLSFLAVVVAARFVYASVREGVVQFGRELEPMTEELGNTKTVIFNGTAMNVSNSLTKLPPKEVLDKLETLCQAHPSAFQRAFEDVPGMLDNPIVTPEDIPHFGVMRAEANGDGAIACFMDDRPASFNDFLARMADAVQSGDLSKMGRFRYVYAGKMPSGQTRVRTIWVDGSFNVKTMFPESGDAVGFDSPVVPRPPTSRRLISATAAHMPFGIHIYSSRNDRESLVEYYDREMVDARDWKRVGTTPEGVTYTSGVGHVLYVSFVKKRGQTLVTTLETARASDPGMVEVHN